MYLETDLYICAFVLCCVLLVDVHVLQPVLVLCMYFAHKKQKKKRVSCQIENMILSTRSPAKLLF